MTDPVMKFVDMLTTNIAKELMYGMEGPKMNYEKMNKKELIELMKKKDESIKEHRDSAVSKGKALSESETLVARLRAKVQFLRNAQRSLIKAQDDLLTAERTM